MKRTIVLAALACATLAGQHDARGRGVEPRDDLAANALPPIAPAPGMQGASSPLALASLDRKVADLDAQEQSTKREMAELGPKLAEVRGRVSLRGRALYRLTRLGMLPIGGGFDALVTHAMRVERARHSLQSELTLERTLRGKGAELARSLERLAQDRIAFATQRQAMDAARVQGEEESRRKEAFERAFETGAQGSEYVAIYGSTGGNDPVAIGGFSGSKGRLLFPVLGRAEVRTAKREAEGGSGLEVRAPLGATVRAVFAGRVAFADRYGSYGRIVILDHGERYYTVSGNLGQVDVRIGDEVSAGERIGAVGDEGQGALLYFELRHGSQTIPAGPWLGVDKPSSR